MLMYNIVHVGHVRAVIVVGPADMPQQQLISCCSGLPAGLAALVTAQVLEQDPGRMKL